jgi:predicted ribosomally synthesized peptide with SipW-like signal peptide
MTKILMSLMAVALIGGLVGGGLFAHFQDTETSEGNTFTAAEMDLQVGWEYPNTQNIGDLKPCQWFKWQHDTVNNVGDMEGSLSINLDITAEGTGLFVEPEQEAEGDAVDTPYLADLLDVVILYAPVVPGYDPNDPPINLLHVIQEAGATTYDEAAEALKAHCETAGIVGTEIWAGKLRFLLGELPLALMQPNQQGILQVFIHLEQEIYDGGTLVLHSNAAMDDSATVDKTLKLIANCRPPGGGDGKVIPLPVPCQDEIILSYNHAGKDSDNPGFGVFTADTPGGDQADDGCSYFKVKFSGIPGNPGDYAVQDGVIYRAWCLDDNHYVKQNQKVNLYSSLDPAVYDFDPDWNTGAMSYANYLINRYDGDCSACYQTCHGMYAGPYLQQAVWYFLDGWSTHPCIRPPAWAMINDALANGEGFIPGISPNPNPEGPDADPMALVIAVSKNTGVQILGIEVDP